MVDILTSTNTWYRPSDVCAAPDGSIYIADWNDAGVGGHYMADQKLETMTGRIYRVAPKGHKASVPKLNLATAAGCVEALQSPNLETRYLAWTKLNEMQGKAEDALLKLWAGKDAKDASAGAASFGSDQGKREEICRARIESANSDIRITALRIARERKLDVIPYVKMLITRSFLPGAP